MVAAEVPGKPDATQPTAPNHQLRYCFTANYKTA